MTNRIASGNIFISVRFDLGLSITKAINSPQTLYFPSARFGMAVCAKTWVSIVSQNCCYYNCMNERGCSHVMYAVVSACPSFICLAPIVCGPNSTW